MAVYEQSTLLRCKDENGNKYLLYPITKLDCVDGAEDLVHYDKDQELTAVQKARFLKNIGGLCAPVSAQTNQFLKVSAVDEHGNVTAVETAEGPTEASAVDIYTQADEPVGAEDGSVWFNTGNADGTISILVRKNGSWEMSSDGVAQVQPDWDETDASNPGYVRNKPFGYTADLYANSTLPFAVGTNKNNIYSARLPTGLLSSLQEGDNVTVVWDGTVYELTAKEVRVTDFMSASNALGNGRIISESFGLNLDTDTGEPFGFIPALNTIYTRSTMSTHSLQIKDDETIIKIDAKFLPDEALNASVQSDWNETDESSAAFILNKPEIPDTDNFAKTEDIPTKVSELENDEGYLKEHQSLEGLATEVYVQTEIGKLETPEQVQSDWDETDESSPAFIANKPEIPDTDNFATKDYVQEQLSGVSAPDMTGYAKSEDIPTNISQLTNDAGYLTEQIQVDWDETDTTSPAYIKNKPIISGDGSVSIQSNWEQTDESQPDFIKNKPFGEVEGLVDVLPLTQYDNFWLNSNFGTFQQAIRPYLTMAIGDTYIISWDGNEYECVVQDVSAILGAGAVGLGNGTPFGMPGNNEPFIIANEPSGYLSFIALTDTEAGGSHTIGIATNGIVITKIDAKYLPDDIGGSFLPEVNTDDNNKVLTVVDGVWETAEPTDWSTLKNKPFYDYEDLVDVLPLTNHIFGYVSSYGLYGAVSETSFTLTIGETYTVYWDGIKYECVSQDVSSFLGDGAIALGNCSAFGFSGNDEPFIIETDSYGSIYAALTDTEDGTSHSIRVCSNGIFTHQIDPKYIPIPFFGEETVTILDCEFQDTRYDSDGDGVDDAWNTNNMMIEDTSEATLEIGETYTVTWDNIEYEVEGIDCMGLCVIGNTLAVDGEDNGLPFAILRDATGTIIGTPGWAAIVISPPDITASGLYSCKIEGVVRKKIDAKYLPDDIGGGSSLPEVTVDDNGHVMTVINGAWGVSALPSGLPTVTSDDDGKVLTVSDGAWEALPSGLPTVTSDDDGKVLTVSDGAWVVQTITHPVELPTVTADDAGKFLRVSTDGTWIVETIQNVSEVGL